MHLVLNWLWQGAFVALTTAALLRMMTPCRAGARYFVVWGGCVALVSLPVVPLIWAATLFQWSPPSADLAMSAVTPVVSLPQSWWTSTTTAFGFWAVWASVEACRLAMAALTVGDAKRKCTDFPCDVERRLCHWGQLRAIGRRTRLRLSTRVGIASVLGGGSPVIAVAPSLIQHLSDADLDRVLIHEWTHVQRRDDVAQVAQCLVRVVAGWHPGLWWLERQLHLEREVACDEAVIAMTGSAKDYAGCLAGLASLPGAARQPKSALAVASSPALRRRIERIFSASHLAPAPRSRASVVAAAACQVVLVLILGRLHVVGVESDPATVISAVPSGLTSTFEAHMSISPQPFSLSFPNDTPIARPFQSSPRGARRVNGETGVIRVTESPSPAAERSPARTFALAPQPPDQPVESTPFMPPILLVGVEPPGEELAGTLREIPVSDRSSADDPPTTVVWGAAADAGKAVGRGSERAALATAGFVTRLGKKIADSF